MTPPFAKFPRASPPLLPLNTLLKSEFYAAACPQGQIDVVPFDEWEAIFLNNPNAYIGGRAVFYHFCLS